MKFKMRWRKAHGLNSQERNNKVDRDSWRLMSVNAGMLFVSFISRNRSENETSTNFCLEKKSLLLD